MTKTLIPNWIKISNTILLIMLFILFDLNSIQNWIQILAILFCFYSICMGTKGEQELVPGKLEQASWVICSLSIIALVLLSQNPVLSLYLIGVLFLILIYINCLFNRIRESHSRSVFLIIGCLITLALAASPITISRIELTLDSLAVPSKFKLQSAPDAKIQHYTSRGFPFHHLGTFKVQLSANNLELNEPMPLIGFSPRRETLFQVRTIRYAFLHTAVHALHQSELHSIALENNNEGITLENNEKGIAIFNIRGGQTAWIQAPNLDTFDLATKTIIKITAMKVIVWWLICLGYWLWAPGKSSENSRLRRS